MRYIGKRDIAKIDRWAVMDGAALIAERTGFFQSVGMALLDPTVESTVYEFVLKNDLGWNVGF